MATIEYSEQVQVQLNRFRKMESNQQKLFPDKPGFGVIIKEKRVVVSNIDIYELRTAFQLLIRTFKPHLITKDTFCRWNFGIPLQLEELRATGISMIVEWHLDKADELEYLTIKIDKKDWIKGHFPPVLWSQLAGQA